MTRSTTSPGKGIISAEAEGLTLVPPSFVGLENESESDFSVSLRDETRPEDRAWELTYSTTYDPDFDNRSGGTGGYTDSAAHPFKPTSPQPMSALAGQYRL